MGTVALRLSGGHKSYAGRPVLTGVDLELEFGGRLAILGPTGAGKSTLLRILAGLEPPDGGALVTDPDATRATVFQRPLLLPWLTVRENIELGGRYRANRERFDPAGIAGLLALLGLADLADMRPDRLSGGQAQRVAIARALAVRPRVLLLDEPFSALDPATRTDLRRRLRDSLDRLSVSMVLITHDVDEALYLADTVAVLDGSGSIRSIEVTAHDGDGEHPLRETLLAEYRSQLGAAG
ncbi:ABC transporter ATP-binding protein [Nocardia sp. BMG51109]|uniref:ABC transporter ATP-binding protein n=1 Tax=Nocardia sp. BMG51109 TaxID=1056816 RepID=UPI00046692B6|nr:ATP-binding cassette domain-containing protein [Nocardia sp. BMG51109]